MRGCKNAMRFMTGMTWVDKGVLGSVQEMWYRLV